MNFMLLFLQGNVPPVLRTILEVLPLLRPTEHISSMWLILLPEFLQYLPKQDSHLKSEDDKIEQARSYTSDHASGIEVSGCCN